MKIKLTRTTKGSTGCSFFIIKKRNKQQIIQKRTIFEQLKAIENTGNCEQAYNICELFFIKSFVQSTVVLFVNF